MKSQTEHGQPGHLNTVILDHASPITGYGRHARVVAFLPDGEGLYARVDYVHADLPTPPTAEEILKVARLDQGVKGRWQLARRVQWENNGSNREDVHFTRQ